MRGERGSSPSRTALPVRVRLSLVLGGLLLLTGVTTSTLAYLDVRRAQLSAAQERLSIATSELVGTWDDTSQRLRELVATLGDRPEIVTYLESPEPSSAEAVVELLGRVPRVGLAPATLELWDASGSRLLEAGDQSPPISPEEATRLIGLLDRESTALALTRSEGGISLTALAPVGEGSGPLGFVARRQAFAGGEGTAPRRLRGLLGLDASVYLGDASAGLWTDLSAQVPPPPLGGALEEDDGIRYRRDDGQRVLASLRTIPGTPLVALLESPLHPLLADARAAGLRLALITLGATAIAIVVVWLLCSRLTQPLAELADAATAIADGDYESRVAVGSPDEVGRLAEAFNRMADSVEQAHHRLEERVAERTVELSAANEELEAFSYSVSHDLRAPLRAIDGFCQALLEDCATRLDGNGRGHLERVRAASQRMAQLIDELLRLSRLTRWHLEPEPVDLSALAEELTEQLRVRDPGRNVEVDIAAGLCARGDRGLLRVLFENLLGNAWKFTANEEQARIELGVDVDGNGREPVYYVRDNGAGFDMTYAGKLFAPFQRLHKPTEYEGSGIGLATVQRIVRRHGGRVWAEGEVDRGATFRFTLGAEQREEGMHHA